MKISKNSVVEVTYELYDDQGNAIVHDGEPLTYLHGGYGGTFPKVEAALDGKDVGDQVELTLTPNDHFGEIQDEYFKAKVQSVREATAEEIAHGHVHGPHGHHHHH